MKPSEARYLRQLNVIDAAFLKAGKSGMEEQDMLTARKDAAIAAMVAILEDEGLKTLAAKFEEMVEKRKPAGDTQ